MISWNFNTIKLSMGLKNKQKTGVMFEKVYLWLVYQKANE